MPVNCFNPCFVGEGIQTAQSQNVYRPDLCFNPCFVGEGIQTKRKPETIRFITPVSILVLLEKGFRLSDLISVVWNPFGFNPCFVGEGIQTKIRAICDVSRDSFNPCFVGEGIQTIGSAYVDLKLQKVSILVLLEKGFRRWSRCRSKNSGVCFNPCFVGEGIQTERVRPFIGVAMMFQSLFCWRRDSDCPWASRAADCGRVSILVLLEKGFRLQQWSLSAYSIPSFNPCFVGEGIQTLIPLIFLSYNIWVSILVLLEKGFRPKEEQAKNSLKYVSILVLLEKGFRQ